MHKRSNEFRPTLSRLSVLLLGLGVFSAAQAASQYRLIDLGTLGGSGSWPEGIDAAGQVVGNSTTAGPISGYTPTDGPMHPFLYADGVLSDLFPLIPTIYANPSVNDINNHGKILGNYGDPNQSRPFLFDRATGGSVALPKLTPSSLQNSAFGLNNLGVAVGWADQGERTFYRAFAHDSVTGAMTNLGTFAGGYSSCAYDINDLGQIAGWADNAQARQRAVRWEADGRMVDLGVLGTGWHSQANAINAYGVVVGSSQTDAGPQYSPGTEPMHAFLSDGRTLADLGTLGGTWSYGNDINNRGQVVGNSYLAGDAEMVGFLYEGGSLLNLNDLLDAQSRGWVINAAERINDAGQIAAYACTVDPIGPCHAVLLDPVTQPSGDGDLAVQIADAPDPATVGGTLTYTITVANRGPGNAEQVGLSDTLAPGVNLLGVRSSQGGCTAAGALVECALGGVGANSVATVVIQARADTTGTLGNRAVAVSATPDANPADNSATVLTTVNPAVPADKADLALTMKSEPATTTLGGELKFKLLVSNKGPNPASATKLVLNLPSGIGFKGAEPGICGGQPLTCNLATLASNGTSELVVFGLPKAVGSWSVSATVSSATPDPVGGNNGATARVTVK